MSAPESIELLTKSGIDFKRHEEQGIDLEYFGELLITSGLVLFEDVKWVSFHRSVRALFFLFSPTRCSP
jgi:CCR4-NOT transcription complex subunit 7/8